MAAFALTNMFVELNSADQSDTIKSATLTLDSAQLDTTTMGDGWTEMIGGVKSGTLSLEFVDDVAASEIDSVLFPLFGTVVPFKVRPDSAVVGAGNPQYSGSVFIAQTSLGGSHGELAGKSLTFPTSGAVARATA